MQNEQLTVEQMWNRIPEPIKYRLMLIAAECDRACLKHTNWPQDKIHQAAILGEEAGEVLKAALQNKYEDGSADAIKEEAIQTGAMALRMLIHTAMQVPMVNPYNCYGRKPHCMDFEDAFDYETRLDDWEKWERANNYSQEKWITETDTQVL